jgi:hypothetical protein
MSQLPDEIAICLHAQPNAQHLWEALEDGHLITSEVLLMNKRMQMGKKRCKPNGNIQEHCNAMLMECEEFTQMGGTLTDQEFVSMLLGSLPEHYHRLVNPYITLMREADVQQQLITNTIIATVMNMTFG